MELTDCRNFNLEQELSDNNVNVNMFETFQAESHLEAIYTCFGCKTFKRGSVLLTAAWGLDDNLRGPVMW